MFNVSVRLYRMMCEKAAPFGLSGFQKVSRDYTA